MTNATTAAAAADSARPNSGFLLMVALLALVAAGKAILYDTLDPDCFWHLRVAEQLQRDGVGPIVDDISFASIKTPWTPYSWLAELGMKLIWDAGGYRLAVLAQALMIGAFIVFVALAAHEATRGRNPLAVIIGSVLAIYLSLPYLSFRPVAFAIMLLALCSWLLLRDRRMEERGRAVWWIIPITALTTNCHFFAVFLPMWIGALFIGAICERQPRQIKRYAIMLMLSIVACAATPMLPGTLRAMWNYQQGDPMVASGVIAEARPLWAGSTGWITILLLLAIVGLAIWRRERDGSRIGIRIGEILWLMAATLLFIRMGRFAPVYVTIAAPLFAACLSPLGGAVLQRRPIRFAVACVILIGIARLVVVFPRSDQPITAWLNRHGPDTPGYPTDATDFVSSRIPSGRIINEFTWGGYIAWRLGDRYQVFVDGRTQLYTPAFWQTTHLGEVEASRPVLDASSAQAAILPANRSRFRDVLIDMGWQSVYRDDRAEVLVPSATASAREAE